MQLVDLAHTSAAVAATPARSEKVRLLAERLRAAAAGEVPIVVGYLSGELRQRRTGLGFASLRGMPPPASEPTLTVLEVDAALEAAAALSGPGSTNARRFRLHELLARATAQEQRLIAGLLLGELRHGALEGLMTDAVAVAARLPLPDVRRAVMLRGALAPVAAAALSAGAAGLGTFRLQVGQPLQPMLAQTSESVTAALERINPAAVDWKLDGIRVQAHRSGGDVAVFSRSLDDLTARLPEVVDAVLALPVSAVVLDGEVIALRPDGKPRPFQVTASRTGSTVDVTKARASTPLHPFFFDLLHLDGGDLLGEPADRRFDAFAAIVAEALRVPRLVTDDAGQAGDHLDHALARGHEGIVVKALDAAYEAGRRGGAWLKVKPRHTLDLVVLAAEWGHGRRTGRLSNLHLGAREPADGSFVMLGKTFKGLTDAMLAWQTERLLSLESGRSPGTVHVRPELVVEVAFDGVQASPRYPAGMALRFARVLRHRPDKPASEADTVEAVRAVHARSAEA